MAVLHRRARCNNPLTAAASLADGAAGPVVAAAPRRLRPKHRAHLAATFFGAASLFRCRRSNLLMSARPADGATGAAAASEITAPLQRRRHQHHADLPASAHVWLSWDRAVAAEAKHLYSPSISLFSLSSLALSYPRTSHSIVHFPHHISVKLVLLAEKS